MKKETIYLAGGCFWGTEKYMQGVDGVLETRVGYALGEKPLWNPPLKESVTYEEVCNHSGHAEAVEVVFDAELWKVAVNHHDIVASDIIKVTCHQHR